MKRKGAVRRFVKDKTISRGKICSFGHVIDSWKLTVDWRQKHGTGLELLLMKVLQSLVTSFHVLHFSHPYLHQSRFRKRKKGESITGLGSCIFIKDFSTYLLDLWKGCEWFWISVSFQGLTITQNPRTISSRNIIHNPVIGISLISNAFRHLRILCRENAL